MNGIVELLRKLSWKALSFPFCRRKFLVVRYVSPSTTEVVRNPLVVKNQLIPLGFASESVSHAREKSSMHDLLWNSYPLTRVWSHKFAAVDGVLVFEIHVTFGKYQNKNLLWEPVRASVLASAFGQIWSWWSGLWCSPHHSDGAFPSLHWTIRFIVKQKTRPCNCDCMWK